MPRRSRRSDDQQIGDGVEFRGFTAAERAETHPNQNLRGCLNFADKPEFYRRLQRNAPAEIIHMLDTFPSVPLPAHERARYGMHFYTLTKFCFLEPTKPGKLPVILDKNLLKLVFALALHPNSYDVWIPDESGSVDFETASFEAIYLVRSIYHEAGSS